MGTTIQEEARQGLGLWYDALPQDAIVAAENALRQVDTEAQSGAYITQQGGYLSGVSTDPTAERQVRAGWPGPLSDHWTCYGTGLFRPAGREAVPTVSPEYF